MRDGALGEDCTVWAQVTGQGGLLRGCYGQSVSVLPKMYLLNLNPQGYGVRRWEL